MRRFTTIILSFSLALMTVITVEADMKDFAIPRSVDIPVGAYGVWQIPALDIAIPVYQTSNRTQTQNVVDCDTSASIRKWGAGRIIEDHLGSVGLDGRGIWNVSMFAPDTAAFLVTPTVTYCYRSVLVCRCDRQSNCITLDGKALWPMRQTNVVCVSCANTSGDELYYAEFKLTGSVPS